MSCGHGRMSVDTLVWEDGFTMKHSIAYMFFNL